MAVKDTARTTSSRVRAYLERPGRTRLGTPAGLSKGQAYTCGKQSKIGLHTLSR